MDFKHYTSRVVWDLRLVLILGTGFDHTVIRYNKYWTNTSKSYCALHFEHSWHCATCSSTEPLNALQKMSYLIWKYTGRFQRWRKATYLGWACSLFTPTWVPQHLSNFSKNSCVSQYLCKQVQYEFTSTKFILWNQWITHVDTEWLKI